MKFKIFIILISFISLSAQAGTSNYGGTWVGAGSSAKINNDFSFFHSGDIRYHLDKGEINQILNSIGIKHKKANLSHAVFYGFMYTENNLKEHRLSYKLAFPLLHGLNVSSAVEWRNLEDHDDTSYRIRPRIEYTKEQYLIWNELFINLTRETWTGERTVERNRFFIGLQNKIGDINYSIGYMNQYIPRDLQSFSEHILKISFSY